MMRYIELNGSPRDIGHQHGAAFAADIQHYYDFYCLQHGKTPDKLPSSVTRYVERHLPAIAEEIDGIAAGAGMAYDEVMAYNHFNVFSGCTPVFFRHTPDGPLLAQNLDCGLEEQQAVVLRKVKPKTGYVFQSVSFVGTVWAGNPINETGLCHTGVSSHQSEYRTEDGTSGGIIAAQVIQHAATVQEVLEILKAHPNIGKVGCSLYLDGKDQMMITEGTPTEKYGIIVKEEFAFSTGLFVSGKVTAKAEPDYLRPKIARKETIDALHAAGAIDYSVEGMKKLLSHHAPAPGSVCRHDVPGGNDTQSARIIIRDQRKLLITDGPPCCTPWQEFSLND